MGVYKFRLNPPDLAGRIPGLRRAYVTGQDRTPGRVMVEVRPGQLTISRPNPESGRVHVPWPVEGLGTTVIATATLAERAEPYDLAVELARGRLNDVRNQAADWQLMGLETPSALDERLLDAGRAFAQAATSRNDPAADEAARRSLVASFRAAEVLMASYTEQVLKRRREYSRRLSTLLSVTLDGDPKKKPGYTPLLGAFNAARLPCSWAKVAPTEGRLRWEETDAQLAW